MKLREPMPALSGAKICLNGEVSREQLIGIKPTLIHFWSVSCYLCKEVMPQFNQIRDGYHDKLNVIAIHMPRTDEDFNIDAVIHTAAEHGITQPILLDGENKLTDQFKNQYVPAYYLFDKNGSLRHFQTGGSGMKMLEKRINRVINEME
jgi:thiol-disulfide isomerase/thioredoxin